MFFLWFFGVGVVDVFQPVPRPASRFAFSLRSASRSVFRLAFRPVSHVSLLSQPFGPPHRFVSPFWRVGWSILWVAPFLSALCGGRSFVFFRASMSWRWRILCRIVDGGGSADGVACRVAGCGACCSARRQAGRDDRSPARRCSSCRSLAHRSFAFSFRLSRGGGEAIDAPFLSARLGGLSGCGGVVNGCAGWWHGIERRR